MAGQDKTPKNEEVIRQSFDKILNYDPSDSAVSIKLIKSTEDWISEHCSDSHSIKYTQLRSIYQLIKDNKDNLILALPRVVYKEASQDFKEQKEFVNIIRTLMEKAIEEEKADAFINYLTTIVAYHKFYSSSKKSN